MKTPDDSMPSKKGGLALLLALGKSKPDDGGGATQGGETDDGESSESANEPDGDENCIMLPKGFKAPNGATDGESVTTTVRGKIFGSKFKVESIGNMPLSQDGEQPTTEDDGSGDETDDTSQMPTQEPNLPTEETPDKGYARQSGSMKRKRMDEEKARNVFQKMK